MSERLPELDQVESHDAAANDAQYDIPSAEVIDITSGEPYVPEGESIIEELTPSAPPSSPPAETPIPSSYEAALKRYGLTPDPSPIEEGARPLAPEAELDEQDEAMQALIEGIPSIAPTVAPSEAIPATAPEEAPLPIVDAELEVKNEVPPDILASYKEKFGINKEDLEGIEGFDKLSRGQQRQVLENLAQLTVGRIREEAVDGHKDDIEAQKKNANFLGKVWIGVKDSFTKKFDIVGREKKLAADIEKGGIEEHKGQLEQMVKGMNELGPAVNENKETGELEVQFVETLGMSPELAKVAEVFNEQGTAFSKIPYEWSLDSADPKQQKAYQKAKETYELQRGVLMKRMADAGGPEMATKAMAHTESVIEMQRFIQTCPDAGKELESIQDQNAWTAALKSVGTERGAYMALGVVTRTAVGAMAGFVAAPAAAALTGAIRGWKKAGDELRERDANARKGIVDESEEAKNMVAAVRAKEGDAEVGYRGSVEKIDALVKKLGGKEDSTKSKEQLVTSLRQRIDYTKQKISEGKMVFGESGERLANQYALMKSLAEAEAAIAGETFADERGQRLEERLARMLNKTENEIVGARSDYKFKQAVKAGLTGAAFAGVGAAAVETLKWMNGAPAPVAEYVADKIGKAKAAVGAAVSEVTEEVTPEYVPYVDGSQALIEHAPKPEIINGLDLPPDYKFPATEPPINGLDLPPDYKFPTPPGEEWVETPGGLNVLREDLIAAEGVPSHVVMPGENLSKIFAEEIPGSTNAEVIRLLKGMSPEQLKEIGVTSGNPDLIHPGDNIDVAKMRELLLAQNSTPSDVPSSPEYVDGSQALPRGPGGGGGDIPPGGVETAQPGVLLYENDGTPSSTGTVIEAGPKVPLNMDKAPSLLTMTRAEIEAWSKDAPLPHPMTEAEIVKVFGEKGDGMRTVAEQLKATIGRYPNEDEADMFVELGPNYPKGLAEMTARMKDHPMSYNELNGMVQKARVLGPDAASAAEVAPAAPKSNVPWEEQNTVRVQEEQAAEQARAAGTAERLIDPNRPEANPLNQAAAAKYFGAEGTANRDLAEKMLREAGRYPNKAELAVFREYQTANPAAAKSLLEHMRTGSVMTENEALKLGKQNYDPEYVNSAKKGLFREDAYKPSPVRPETTPGLRTGIESGPVPARTLSQLSEGELDKWPFDKPSPWPVNQSEASELYGDLGTTNRTLAENMRQILGRYPNEEEYLGFRKIKDVDPNASRDMLLAMKKSPQSFAQVRTMTQSVLSKQPAPVVAPTARGMTGLQMNDTMRAVSGMSGNAGVRKITDVVGQQAASGVGVVQGAGAVLSQTSSNPALKAVGEFLRKGGQ